MVDGELDGPKLLRTTVDLVQDDRPGLPDRNDPLGHLRCRQCQIGLCAGELCESRLAARMQSLRKHRRRFFERFPKTTLDQPRTESVPGTVSRHGPLAPQRRARYWPVETLGQLVPNTEPISPLTRRSVFVRPDTVSWMNRDYSVRQCVRINSTAHITRTERPPCCS